MSSLPPRIQAVGEVEETVPEELQREWESQQGCLVQAFLMPVLALLLVPALLWPLLIFSFFGSTVLTWLACTAASIMGMVQLFKALDSITAIAPATGYPFVKLAGSTIEVTFGKYHITCDMMQCIVREGDAAEIKLFSSSRKPRPRIVPARGVRVLLIDIPPFTFGPIGELQAPTTVAVGFTQESRTAWTTALSELLGEIPYRPKQLVLTESEVEGSVRLRDG